MTTILVIDDDANLATVFCDLLDLNGFNTLRAATGHEGIQLAQRHHPQLIVCDIELPDINGYEVLSNLRSHPTTMAIPIITLTGHDISATFRRSMEHGADDHLTKPTDLQSFLRAVQTQLSKRAQLAKCLAPTEPPCQTLPPAITWVDLKEHIEANIKQAPWSNTWIIRLNNHGALQTSYGHVFSQLVLQSLGQQLRQWQQAWNNPTLSIQTLNYLEGNQFVLFLNAPQPPNKTVCGTVMANLRTDLQQPRVINNHRLIPDIHIESINGRELAALPPRGTPIPPQPQSAPAVNQLSLAERLRRAMQRDELQLYFQPQVDLTSGQIIGAEALVRWHLPSESPVSPVQFISVAEEHGLMLPLGDWILETALQQLARWQKIQLSGISIAINLSAHQFRNLNFVDRLMTIVNATQVSPIMIDLELPERLIMEDLNRSKWLLTELQHQGFSTAIDDFGSGSLSHLQYLPINILKLDKCFVRDLHNNSSNQVIVRAIMDIAQGLNISTIANGVETARELSILKQLRCHSMQGYLFSPALPAQDFEKLLLESSPPSKTDSNASPSSPVMIKTH